MVQALDYLQSIGACVLGKKKLMATKSGELLAALPFQVHDSHKILEGAQLGLLHESLVLRSICTHKPAPITHYFGDSYRNDSCILKFYPQADTRNSTSVNIANLSAFLFWDAAWNGVTGMGKGLFDMGAKAVKEQIDKNKKGP